MTNQLKSALALMLCLALALSGCALPSPVPVEDGATNVSSDFTPSGDAAAQPASSSAYLVDTVDMAGNAIRLSAYPDRIVVLDPADCEVLYAIGAGERIVGRSIGCDYPAEATLLPYATVDGKTDPELLLQREPQLVIMGMEDAQDADLISALANASIPVVVTNVTDINNMYGAISLLGTVTNHAAEAGSLVSQIITDLAALQAKISSHSETVYLELTPLADGMTTLGGSTVFSSLVSLLGYHNEFEDQAGLISVTQDQVVGRSPDIIITAAQSAADAQPEPDETADPNASPDPAANESAPTGPAEILARSEWTQVDAVKNNRVYYIDPALITRAGPRILAGAAALYTALYEGKQPE